MLFSQAEKEMFSRRLVAACCKYNGTVRVCMLVSECVRWHWQFAVQQSLWVYSCDLKRQWLHIWYFQLWQWAGLRICVTKYCFFSLYFRDMLLVMLSFYWVFLGCGFATDKDWADGGKDLTASPSLVSLVPALRCCRGSCRNCMIGGSNVAPPPWQPTVRSA